jgi:hypothetical protein
MAYQGTPANIRKGTSAGGGLQPAVTGCMSLDNEIIHNSLFVCLFVSFFLCFFLSFFTWFSVYIMPQAEQLTKL